MKNHGPRREKGILDTKHNKGLYDTYKEMIVINEIKIRRLKGAAHIQRMDRTRIPMKTSKEILYNIRMNGKPRNRLAYAVCKEFQQLII